jgi:hypothetical protein
VKTAADTPICHLLEGVSAVVLIIESLLILTVLELLLLGAISSGPKTTFDDIL